MKQTYVKFDRSKSLQELEGVDWGEPPPNQARSNLVQTVYRLRRVPVGELTAENLRMLSGQCLSLEYVIPLALEYLNQDPWYPGDFAPPYDLPGDLLVFVLYEGIEGHKLDFWRERPDLWAAVQGVVGQAIAQLPNLSNHVRDIITDKTYGDHGNSRLELLMAALERSESQNASSTQVEK